MFKNIRLKKGLLYFIPGLVVLWSVYLIYLNGPFFSSRMDPEYPYLLNGLNCAILEFNRIGHVDHPGTPFQLLTGFFIQLTHLFFGEGNIIDDVISRPEFYLTASSYLFAFLTALIILWLGRVGLSKSDNFLSSIILQSSMFFSITLVFIAHRFIPDRFLLLLVLIFVGLCYQYFYGKKYPGNKFAIYSGIIMGLGFVTKFNFLPLLIIPVFLVDKWKERFIYSGSFLITVFIAFLPILNKFSYFKVFILGLVTHEGIYGTGQERIFDFQKFLLNTSRVFYDYISFSIIFVTAFILLVIMIFKSRIRKAKKKEFRFLISYVIVFIISLIMVSKHYKDYYLIPVMTLSGFVFILNWKIIESLVVFRNLGKIYALLFFILIFVPMARYYKPYSYSKKTRLNKNKTSVFQDLDIPETDFFIIEPTWMKGPLKENGLLYGISYVYKPYLFYNHYEKAYPNILTLNWKNNSLKYFSMLDAEIETILKSGKNIFVYSTPGRNANVLMEYFDSSANEIGISMERDTVFANCSDHEFIIKLKNSSNWKTIDEGVCGFEKTLDNKFYTEDGKTPLSGSFTQNKDESCNGVFSYMLNKTANMSPVIMLKNVSKNDYIELTIKRKISEDKNMGTLILSSYYPAQDSVYFITRTSLSAISNDWELLRISANITHQPLEGNINCFYQYNGNGHVYIDDLSFKHFGVRADQDNN